MKKYSRRIAAVVLAAVLFIAAAPVASAFPRGDRRPDPSKITRIVKYLQRLVGITPHDEGAIPPKP
jgi:hypothetical protein